MLTLDALVVVLLTIALVVFIGEPFLRHTASAPLPQEDGAPHDALTLQKTILYTAIYDLDFDFQTGKVDQQDYEELRSQLEKEAAVVLRQLDQETLLPPTSPSAQAQCPQCLLSLQGGESFCPACGYLLVSSKEA